MILSSRERLSYDPSQLRAHIGRLPRGFVWCWSQKVLHCHGRPGGIAFAETAAQSDRAGGEIMADQLSCPSSHPDQDGSSVIGVVGKREGKLRVSLLPEPVPLAAVADLIPDAVPVTEVLRLGGPCVEQRCGHFENGRCTLASRIVARLPTVVDRLFPCTLRPSCRWWRQEGPAACRRCPQIVSEPSGPGPLMREVAVPPPKPAIQPISAAE